MRGTTWVHPLSTGGHGGPPLRQVTMALVGADLCVRPPTANAFSTESSSHRLAAMPAPFHKGAYWCATTASLVKGRWHGEAVTERLNKTFSKPCRHFPLSAGLFCALFSGRRKENQNFFEKSIAFSGESWYYIRVVTTQQNMDG